MSRNDAGPSIFVSIASYRDPELVPTVGDCLAKARYPERLRFGVCWQHGCDERLPAWFDGENVSVLAVGWQQSGGACWARAAIMDLWEGEDWYLQLDSHHRFAHDWDVRLLEQVAATASPLPSLSTYGTPYSPGVDDGPPARITQMEFDRFTDSGAILTRPGIVGEWNSERPIRARYLSAHFLFAPGRFVDDVPYDPQLYFTGEETTLTVRAYTHGYDLFHPGVPILSHEYTREYRTKHWDDHGRGRQVPIGWDLRDATSHARVERFLSTPMPTFYGLGTARAFSDYERYAGIDFRNRRVRRYTLANLEPPDPQGSDWATIPDPSRT
ncbi:MAG: N-acetylglucosaminyltransferase [Actinobacteria bacterium]|nr:N-acetylglucosaminyltransferase [Actinomycetota bacterium]